MEKLFEPQSYIMVPASAPHPNGTEYRVAIGPENWNGIKQRVIKIQMVYDNKVSGRKSPSFPIESCDWDKVQEAVNTLKRSDESTMSVK